MLASPLLVFGRSFKSLAELAGVTFSIPPSKVTHYQSAEKR